MQMIPKHHQHLHHLFLQIFKRNLDNDWQVMEWVGAIQTVDDFCVFQKMAALQDWRNLKIDRWTSSQKLLLLQCVSVDPHGQIATKGCWEKILCLQ